MAFPDNIDNTFRSSLQTCMTQARYGYIEDLSLPGESVHLVFGGAMATGLEVARLAYYDDKVSHAEAVERGAQAAGEAYGDFETPHRSPKTRANVILAVRYYFTVWPMDTDIVQPIRLNEKLAVEWKFKVPIPDLIHPDHGGPIYYVGRSDMIPQMNGMVIIEDDKTAGQLGEKWAAQWELDSQFLGYIWAAQQTDILVPEQPGTALIRGVGIYTPKYKKPGNTTYAKNVTESQIESGEVVYSMMDSFGHSQAMVNHAPWMVERWLKQLKRDIGRAIYAYINDPDGSKGEWDMALNKTACGGYGGCSYVNLCKAKNPEQWKTVNFIKRKWDPLSTV